MSMGARVTRLDGTRTQIAAEDVESVEPQARGCCIYLSSGETLFVAQDIRTVELRIEAALAHTVIETEIAPEHAELDAPKAATNSVKNRIKLHLSGRSSFGALTIANAWRP